MWLPSPFYERAPQYWLLLGLLFIAWGAYLGFENVLAFVYTGVGVVCVVWSITVIMMRSRNRDRLRSVQDGATNHPDLNAEPDATVKMQMDLNELPGQGNDEY